MVAVMVLASIKYCHPKPSDQLPLEVPNVWGTLRYMVYGLIGGTTLATRRGSETPFVHGPIETPNTSPQAIELKPRCSEQAYSKGPRSDPGNENMEYGCAFEILCAPSIIRPLSRTDA